jgi:chromosome partitioning protein
MPTIAFANIKGGVGKTTLCTHVAAALADTGRSVLVIDLDPQAHASLALGLEPEQRLCVADAFGAKPRHKLDEIVVQSPKRSNLFIAPAALRMAAMERELFQWGHRLHAIPRALKSLSWTPDVIIADTPPNIGAFTEAVLYHADLVVAPVPTGAFALQGLGELENAWREVRDSAAGELVAAVNMWDRRTSATNSAMEGALEDVHVPILKTYVPRSEAINQAGLGYEVIFDLTPKAPGAAELRELAHEIGQRAGLPRLRAVAR